jgi:nitrite reductase/ring-hydroxylating ferredoxin subunit
MANSGGEAPPPLRVACRLSDIPRGGTKNLDGGLFAVSVADQVLIYVNACPHLGVPLDWLPGRFLSPDGRKIVCAMHGAEFRPQDGLCLRGPCRGESLTQVPCVVRDGVVSVAHTAGSPNDQGQNPGPREPRES